MKLPSRLFSASSLSLSLIRCSLAIGAVSSGNWRHRNVQRCHSAPVCPFSLYSFTLLQLSICIYNCRSNTSSSWQVKSRSVLKSYRFAQQQAYVKESAKEGMIIKLELSSLSLFFSLLFFLLQRENLFIFIPLFVSLFFYSMKSLSIILCSCTRFYLFSLFSLHPFFSTVLKPFLCSKCNYTISKCILRIQICFITLPCCCCCCSFRHSCQCCPHTCHNHNRASASLTSIPSC